MRSTEETQIMLDAATSFATACQVVQQAAIHQRNFTEAVAAQDWPAAERFHAAAVSAFDAYFDHYAAAFKRIGDGKESFP
jgi:hypothetical protein